MHICHLQRLPIIRVTNVLKLVNACNISTLNSLSLKLEKRSNKQAQAIVFRWIIHLALPISKNHYFFDTQHADMHFST